jgi:hypothetical protein
VAEVAGAAAGDERAGVAAADGEPAPERLAAGAAWPAGIVATVGVAARAASAGAVAAVVRTLPGAVPDAAAPGGPVPDAAPQPAQISTATAAVAVIPVRRTMSSPPSGADIRPPAPDFPATWTNVTESSLMSAATAAPTAR